MKELLSNEEIDTLVELFRAEGEALKDQEVQTLRDVATGALDLGTVISPVDMLKPNRFTSDQLHAANRFFASTATSIAALVSDRLRIEASCDCVAVEQQRFGDWTEHNGQPGGAYVLSTEPFQLPIVMTVTSGFLHGAVDRILGGSGRVEGRVPELSEAAHSVASTLIEPIVERLAASLSELTPLSARIERRIASLSLAQTVGPNDVVLTLYFQVASDSVHGDVRVALPFPIAEAVVSRLALGRTPEYDASPGSAREAVARALSEGELDFRVALGTARLEVRDLLTLAVGDVVVLDRRVDDPADGVVETETRFQGRIGTRGRSRAFRVTRVMENSDGRNRSTDDARDGAGAGHPVRAGA